MTLLAPAAVDARIREAYRLRLFLDYDGTLAEFAPTPDHVEPDPEIIALVTSLATAPKIRVAVISGRRLDHVEKLVPVPGILIAGTYGLELRLANGERIDRVSRQEVRPVLEAIKPRWQRLLAGRAGFFLEDKGWTLAIHAKFADDRESEEVLEEARGIAESSTETPARTALFRILGGHKFLEIAPALADKGKTVDFVLRRYPWPSALPLYVGDDDKDEEAFGVIHDHGGLAVRVCEAPCETRADGRLRSPDRVREWLAGLVPSLSHPTARATG